MKEREYLRVIGQRVRSARKAAGLTLVQLSELIEIHYSSISMIECGRVAPNVLTLRKIAQAVNVGLRELV